MTTVLQTVEALEAELKQDVYYELMFVRNEARSYAPDDIDEGDGPSIDVLLQVLEDGTWALRTGDSQYDQDHRGFWGASSVAPDDDEVALINTARDLFEQVLEDVAQTN